MPGSSKRYHNGGGPVKERGAGTRTPVPLLHFFSYIACRSYIEMSKIVPEIETRRARRALREEPVPEEVLARIMTAATYAPSCFNNQPWRFLVVSRDRELEHSSRDRKPEDQVIMYNLWVEVGVEQ
jgi:hypothetical protein